MLPKAKDDEIYLHFFDTALSEMAFAVEGTFELPIHADLLTVCDRSVSDTWLFYWYSPQRVACAEV